MLGGFAVIVLVGMLTMRIRVLGNRLMAVAQAGERNGHEHQQEQRTHDEGTVGDGRHGKLGVLLSSLACNHRYVEDLVQHSSPLGNDVTARRQGAGQRLVFSTCFRTILRANRGPLDFRPECLRPAASSPDATGESAHHPG